MSDTLIQCIDLNGSACQAVDYGRGLQQYMVEHAVSTKDIADMANVATEEIEYLIAGTSNHAAQLAAVLWIRGKIHIESMILDGSGFPGGGWTNKVLVVS